MTLPIKSAISGGAEYTHEPFVKMEKKIANTGSWVKPSATYLFI